jgi:tetratricopeptide (TPR) repeat protein
MAPATGKMAVIAFVVGAGLAALIWRGTSEDPPPPVPPKKTACDRAIEALDATIEVHRRRFNVKRKWIEQEGIAFAHLSRAQLTGDPEDYAAADRAVALGFENAIPGSGPFLARAKVSFALHRFDRVEADLAKVASALIVSREERETIEEMRADLLFHQGRYGEAKDAYEAIVARRRSTGALVRLAQYESKTGGSDRAIALIDEALGALPKTDAANRAWLLSVAAMFDLDRGRLPEARARLEQANALFDGWSLVEEQLAKVILESGDPVAAEQRFDALSARTRNPEHLHGLAATFEARGQFDRAQKLHDEAKRLYDARVALLPEAFSAHALSHVLAHGKVTSAVALAEANHRSRPTAEAKVLLAQAYMADGRIDDARSAMEAALSTPISTGELHATAAYVFEAAGDPERAASEKSRSLAIHPRAHEKLAWLRRAPR